MTPPKSKSEDDPTPRGNTANRGRKAPPPEKHRTRTGEFSIEEYKRWLANREAASRAKPGSDKDGGAPG